MKLSQRRETQTSVEMAMSTELWGPSQKLEADELLKDSIDLEIPPDELIESMLTMTRPHAVVRFPDKNAKLLRGV